MGNLGLTGSFVVGGIILFTLIYIQFRIMDTSESQTINEMTQTSMTGINDIMDYDFSKIGYRVSTNPKITELSDTSISFLSDLDNNGSVDTVKYFKRNEQGNKYLVRNCSLSDVKEWQVRISNFSIAGYDSLNNSTLNANLIKSIDIAIVIDNSAFQNDSTGDFGSFYKRKYLINN